jgi:hypothetical protein
LQLAPENAPASLPDYAPLSDDVSIGKLEPLQSSSQKKAVTSTMNCGGVVVHQVDIQGRVRDMVVGHVVVKWVDQLGRLEGCNIVQLNLLPPLSALSPSLRYFWPLDSCIF